MSGRRHPVADLDADHPGVTFNGDYLALEFEGSSGPSRPSSHIAEIALSPLKGFSKGAVL